MPLGHLLDQWEISKQVHNMAQPKRELFIEDVIPYGV